MVDGWIPLFGPLLFCLAVHGFLVRFGFDCSVDKRCLVDSHNVGSDLGRDGHFGLASRMLIFVVFDVSLGLFCPRQDDAVDVQSVHLG